MLLNCGWYNTIFAKNAKVSLYLKITIKEVDLYSTFIVVPHTQGAQVRITQCYLQITPYLPLWLVQSSFRQKIGLGS